MKENGSADWIVSGDLVLNDLHLYVVDKMVSNDSWYAVALLGVHEQLFDPYPWTNQTVCDVRQLQLLKSALSAEGSPDVYLSNTRSDGIKIEAQLQRWRKDRTLLYPLISKTRDLAVEWQLVENGRRELSEGEEIGTDKEQALIERTNRVYDKAAAEALKRVLFPGEYKEGATAFGAIQRDVSLPNPETGMDA
jgi:hypothetical protein